MFILGGFFTVKYSFGVSFSRKLTEAERDSFDALCNRKLNKLDNYKEYYLDEEDDPDTDGCFMEGTYLTPTHWVWLQTTLFKLRLNSVLRKFEYKYNVMARLQHVILDDVEVHL